MASLVTIRRCSSLGLSGMAFFAYQGRVACYERSGFHVLDGLGYVPPAEMAVAGIDAAAIRRSSVLHFNGDRKPWNTKPKPKPFGAYMEAMGDWGQNLTSLARAATASSKAGAAAAHTPPPLELLILVSNPRTGTEWLAKVMAEDVTLTLTLTLALTIIIVITITLTMTLAPTLTLTLT